MPEGKTQQPKEKFGGDMQHSHTKFVTEIANLAKDSSDIEEIAKESINKQKEGNNENIK